MRKRGGERERKEMGEGEGGRKEENEKGIYVENICICWAVGAHAFN